ncbi:hypothetical protein F4825DRAFT_457956 [Nemania diffusa]|nr:hypothetical protein F4825DRAFT_457956 [Nemania diffusa]
MVRSPTPSHYRAAAVSGSVSTGVPAPSLDFVGNLIMNMIRHNTVADITGRDGQNVRFVIDFVPVDALARALLDVSTCKRAIRSRAVDVFHFGSSRPLRLSELPNLVSPIRRD